MRFGRAESVLAGVWVEKGVFAQLSSLLLLEVYYLCFNYLYR